MIYLNNAATSFPKPPEVIKAVQHCLEAIPFHSDRIGFARQEENVSQSCREKLARLFNARTPLEIIFASGATEALNLALFGMDLAGGHVITTTTEHNSVFRPLKTLEQKGRIDLSIVDCDSYGYVNPIEISNAFRENTRLVVVNHCSNVTGAVQDLKSIAAFAHEASALFLVDASQSAGAIDIDVQEDQIDIMAFAGHKSLYGIAGIGGLFLREGIELSPLKVGGTGIRSDLLYQPEGRPIYYEAGSPNVVGIAALQAGVEFIMKTGIETIQRTKRRHINQIVQELKGQSAIHFYGDIEAANFYGPLSINLDGIAPADVGYCLEESFGVITRSGLHCAPLIHKALGSYPEGSVRISPSYFTTDGEIEQSISAFKALCTMGCVL
jgi:cysteine desulfurase / selenocysteine lyase